MNNYTLTNKQIAELESLHRILRDKRQADKVKSVVALAKGWSATQISEILLIDEKTSRKYFQTYLEHGTDELMTMHYAGSEPKLNEEQMKELEKHLDKNIYTNAKTIVHHIKKTYNIDYSLSGVTDVLHRLGFSYKKPKHVPGKADAEKQEAFLEAYEALKASKGKHDQIYFADATHPQHNSVPAYGWIKKGKEKQLKANCGRSRLNINGAINIETMQPIVGFYDTINAQTTIKLFKKLTSKHPDAKKIYVIADNARYYHSKLLKAYIENTAIELVFLPAYSPNLNLIERYWKFFKKKILYNKYYETFDEFKQASKNFFRKRKKYIPELRTLLTENFHIMSAE